MASKTEYELSEPRKALVESDETLKEMKQNGQLIPFTDYYTPDEDEDSSSIIIDYIVPRDTSQVNITELDLIGDGGVYEIDVYSPTQISNWLNLRFNNKNDARYYDRYNTFMDNPISVYAPAVSAFLVGAWSRIAKITLQQIGEIVSVYANGQGLVNGQYATFLTMGNSSSSSNITSIQLFCDGSIPAETRIIVKRTKYNKRGTAS